MRTFLSLSLASGLTLAGMVGAAPAQPAADRTYPDRPVKIVVPFAAAGLVDVIARIVADKLSDRLGERFYIENRGGASGNTGTAAAAAAVPDGYTLLITGSGLVVNPSLFASVPYDPLKDFAPISLLAVSPNVVSVHPSVPAYSARELVDLVKANPGKYTYATAGHLTGELLTTAQGLDLPAVRFTSAGPALQSTVGGHTPIAITALAPATPLIKDGQLRGLMVTSARRVPTLPDVPTATEAGLPGQQTYTLTALLAPAGTPKAIVERLHAETARILRLPEVRGRLEELGFEVVASSPDELAARITWELAHWAKVIRDSKIKPQGTP
jgi:tripartite-type tricarboxylate transporter receptor subunit TctC